MSLAAATTRWSCSTATATWSMRGATGLFDRPHGVTLDPDGTLWCVDDGDHTVRKMTLDGKVLQTLGTAGQPAPFASGEPFNRPPKSRLTR